MLWANGLGSSGVKAFAASRELTNLRHLDLGYNSFGVSGLRALARNPALSGLLYLGLGDRHSTRTPLTAEHLREFLATVHMPNLRHLSLARCPLGAAARLMAGDKFGSLTRLDLNGCGLTEASVAAILTAPSLQNLVELQLANNKLTDGAAPLADRATLPRLARCSLHGNGIPEPLRKKLAKRRGVEV
jgi:hypothetical protein